MSLLIKALKQAEKRHQEVTAQAIEQVSVDPTVQAAATVAPPQGALKIAEPTPRVEAPVVTAGSFAAMSLSLEPADAPDLARPSTSASGPDPLPAATPAPVFAAPPAPAVTPGLELSPSTEPKPHPGPAAASAASTAFESKSQVAAAPAPAAVKTSTFKAGVRSAAQVQGIARPRWFGSRWVTVGVPTTLAVVAGSGWLAWQMWGSSTTSLTLQPPPLPEPTAEMAPEPAKPDPASVRTGPRPGAADSSRRSVTGPAIRGNDGKPSTSRDRQATDDPALRARDVGPQLAMAADTSDAVSRSLQRFSASQNPVSALAPRVEQQPASPAPSSSSMRITRNDTQERVARLLDQAYGALTRQERRSARQLYEQVLELDRLNPDAWLGLASISARDGDLAAAERHYNKVLEIDPNDGAAKAGLASLKVAADPAGQESQLRHLLASDPAQPSVQFALGNSLAAQGRWSDAQQYYFNAFSGDPQNPDYAFNLAISLERLRQPAAAVTYYRKALELGQFRQARFKPEQIQKRLIELERIRTVKEPGVPSVHPNSNEAIAARD